MGKNRKMKLSANKKIRLFVIIIGLGAAAAGIFAVAGGRRPEAHYYPVRGFSNMCAYEGQVYGGANAPYGEPIVHNSSIFTIQDQQIYYVDKALEAFESRTDELLNMKCSAMDGSGERILAEDVFLAGAGYEKLIGDKIFYACGYDGNHRMKYASVDRFTGERKEIPTDRIEAIIGYDGNYLYYRGYDAKKEVNLAGRVYLKTGKDETLFTYSFMDNEEGYLDCISFANGKIYCLALTKAADSYDYRTYEYKIQIRNSGNGKVEKELPYLLTGSSNYSLLVHEDEILASAAGEIIALPVSGEGGIRTVTKMKPGEYWGILHFIPGDGYLYYEAIAEVDEETGENDYFYRVPLTGGEAELLKAWYTV